MELINCLGKDFDDACFNLASDIISSDFNPDIIIGVKTGGAYVSKKIYEYINIVSQNTQYCEVQIQHPTTILMKYIKVKNIFKFIPNKGLNLIRLLNIYRQELGYKLNKEVKRVGNISFPKEIENYIKRYNNNKILIIDDAIDTGKTMSVITDYINNINKNNIIKYGVLTTTFDNPEIKADYSLYNKTILRFPWAFDAFKFK